MKGAYAFDKFDRADSENLGPNWHTIVEQVAIVDHAVIGVNTGSDSFENSFWKAQDFESDQFSQATLARIAPHDYTSGVFVRMSSVSGACYGFLANMNVGFSLYYTDFGGIDEVELGNWVYQNPKVGDVIRVEVSGKVEPNIVLKGYVNNVLVSTYVINSGNGNPVLVEGQPGVSLWTDQNIPLNNWSGGFRPATMAHTCSIGRTNTATYDSPPPHK